MADPDPFDLLAGLAAAEDLPGTGGQRRPARGRSTAPRFLAGAQRALRLGTAVGALLLGGLVLRMGLVEIGLVGVVAGVLVLGLELAVPLASSRHRRWLGMAGSLLGQVTVVYVMAAPMLLLVALMELFW